MSTVLVLGSNGHLGYNLTKQLVERGYDVLAGVRSSADQVKTKHLRELGVEVVDCELLNKDQLRKAMEGVDGVFQLAAVFDLTSNDPKKEVMEPTIQGALNVVEVAAEMKVKKLVFTSSIAAVGTVENGDPALDESYWNERAIEPYAAAKTIAEREAWKLAKKLNVDMVTVLPATMIGPGFFRHTPSTLSFELLLKGKVPFALPMTFEFVDVRDVATAHILAFENKQSSGRYICSGTSMSLKELFAKVGKLTPGVKVPTGELPTGLLFLVPYLDWLGNKLQGTPRFSSKAMIKEYGNRAQRVSSRRIKSELGWSSRPIDNSISDTLGWVQAHYM